MTTPTLRRALALFTFLLIVRLSHGQTFTGTILGTVSDSSGAIIPNVRVVATNESTNVQQSTTTNGSGYFEIPALPPGAYRLEFDVGEYFRDLGLALPQPAFLETVVIDFGIADRTAHYHVPLLVSPYGYSTYRGS